MPSLRRTAVLLACVAALLAPAACGTQLRGTWGEAPRPVPLSADEWNGTIAWRSCQEEAEKIVDSPLSGARAECGTLRVPQDWREPTGPTLELALMRLRRDDQRQRIGSLLVNPGGPGASGLELAAIAPLFLPLDLQRRFDVVGFDPRGVGASTPVECIDDATKDALVAAEPDPTDQAEFDRQVALYRGIGQACARKYGARLGLFGTEQAARDMDAIRHALGEEKLTYLGYSYGTLLGAVYAQLFGDRVRALVLDGAVDPRQDDVAATESQAAGFEKAFDQFAAACRAKGGQCLVGPDARATVRRVLAQVRARPVPGRDGDGRRAEAGHVVLAVVSSLYSRQRWPELEKALADVAAGDPSRVLALSDEYNERDADGHYANLIDANTAVRCADEASTRTPAQVRQLHAAWRAKYPLFGPPLAMSVLACALWPAERDPYPVGPARGKPPILVVGTTGDPATPYENAPALARLLGTGVVLTALGEGHTSYPQGRCVREAVDRFLIELVAPARGTVCRLG